MNRRTFLQTMSIATLAAPAGWAKPPLAQSQPTNHQRWIAMAEKLKPRLKKQALLPNGTVKPVADSTRFLGWRMEPTSSLPALRDRLLKDGESFILDFGRHLTGHFSFSILGEGRGVDAPVRLALTFGEVPAEVVAPLNQYKGGLSRAWLQDEVINIDVLPATVHLPRRYAFRYVKVEVIATSPNFGVRFDHAQAVALTSAGANRHPLPAKAPEALRRIDEVSLATLRDCMQTVFEDGPKRDRRLWIGDLRLQAITNYATFEDFDLVKRCLFLFAGLPREDGLVAACVFEEPKPLRGHEYIIDYAALYAAAVLDYARASKDWKTARDLWPVVRRQMELLSGYVDRNGLFAAPQGAWVFVDWHDQLDRTAAMQGIFVFCLRQAAALAQTLNQKLAVAEYTRRITEMTAAARKEFFDPASRLFVSGSRRQVSWASQTWMVLSEIATPEQAKFALSQVRDMPDAIRPGGPYLYHYYVEALLKCGLQAQALDLIKSYWGGMVKDGADTFWEVYDPANPALSPYGDALVNSYCHAWSCTPAYLIRAAGLP